MVKPLITREMRERARRAPNSWLHVVDPAHDGASTEAVVGRYLVDARGEITDQYVPNPRYQAHEITFDNDLESVMYLVRRGYADKRELVDAVLAAELVLPADPVREPRRHLVMRGMSWTSSLRSRPGRGTGRRIGTGFAGWSWPWSWTRWSGLSRCW